MKEIKSGKRLFRYALTQKKVIIIALVMLSIAVTAELTGPFIAKRMIDEHILGIEKRWVLTEQTSPDTVKYQGDSYIREDRAEQETIAENKINRVLQVGRDYYFLAGDIAFDGERSVQGNELTISRGEQTETYEVQELSNSELLNFYQSEVKYLIF